MITSLTDLKKLLKILRESGVQVYKHGDIQIVMAVEYEVVDDEDEEKKLDEKDIGNPMGFQATDYRGIGVATEFDE